MWRRTHPSGEEFRNWNIPATTNHVSLSLLRESVLVKTLANSKWCAPRLGLKQSKLKQITEGWEKTFSFFFIQANSYESYYRVFLMTSREVEWIKSDSDIGSLSRDPQPGRGSRTKARTVWLSLKTRISIRTTRELGASASVKGCRKPSRGGNGTLTCLLHKSRFATVASYISCWGSHSSPQQFM